MSATADAPATDVTRRHRTTGPCRGLWGNQETVTEGGTQGGKDGAAGGGHGSVADWHRLDVGGGGGRWAEAGG